jgi:UDP-N-acetylmuramoyl-L-alanyl-D-glutamate--2,6-diaminopimelate ligase
VAIEVSSIGLDQRRMAGLEIDVGAFTNFTQDHLDYHQNMQNYFDCKMILFEKIVQKNGYAVLNSDIKEFACIKKVCQKNQLKIIDYGYEAHALKIIKIQNQKVVSIDFQKKGLYIFYVQTQYHSNMMNDLLYEKLSKVLHGGYNEITSCIIVLFP